MRLLHEDVPERRVPALPYGAPASGQAAAAVAADGRAAYPAAHYCTRARDPRHAREGAARAAQSAARPRGPAPREGAS